MQISTTKGCVVYCMIPFKFVKKKKILFIICIKNIQFNNYVYIFINNVLLCSSDIV